MFAAYFGHASLVGRLIAVQRFDVADKNSKGWGRRNSDTILRTSISVEKFSD
jgi:hypothetical protein